MSAALEFRAVDILFCARAGRRAHAAALDPLIRRKLQDELLTLQERVRKTILFVSHDLDEALKLGDKATILEGGHIVQTGTGREIVEHPADDYVAEFVAHVNPRTTIKGTAIKGNATSAPTA